MAYPIFILIGLLFDIIVLAASGALIYISIQPDILGSLLKPLQDMLGDQQGRIQLLIAGSVFFILSFRGIFLLIVGRGSPEIEVASGQSGSVSISHASMEHILRKLVELSGPGATLRASAASAAGTGAVSIRLRVELDLVGTNLNEYSAGLEQTVRSHFKDKLGLEVKQFRIRAEYSGRTAKGGAH